MTSWTLAGFSSILALKHHDCFVLFFSWIFHPVLVYIFLICISDHQWRYNFFLLLCIEFCFCGFEVVHVKWLKKNLDGCNSNRTCLCSFICIAFPCVSDGGSIQAFSYSSSNMFEMVLCSSSELKVHLRVTTAASFPSVHLHTCVCHSLSPHWSQLHSWHQ